MVRRLLLSAALAALAGLGCHASPPPNAAKSEPPITVSDVTATKFIAAHNKNAELIRSIKAAPSIVLLGEHNEREAKASGHLAFERDKNFRLELDGPLRHTVADIGSNDQGFWFWVEDKKEKSLYFCDHADINSCQLAVTLQPDWIIEAMGLRPFTDREARVISAKPGDKPGVLVLTQSRKDAKGQTYTKETLVNEPTGRILEHRLYLGAKKELIASASITNYIKTMVTEAPAQANDDQAAAAAVQTAVYTPDKFRLSWVKENFAIEITMPKPEINPNFTQRVKMELFTEPKIAGVTRRDLAQLDLNTIPASGPQIRETRPMPRSGGIPLNGLQPVPGDDGGTIRRAIDPIPLTPDLPSTPAQPSGVVGAVIPTGNASGNYQAAASFRSATLGR